MVWLKEYATQRESGKQKERCPELLLSCFSIKTYAAWYTLREFRSGRAAAYYT